MRAYFIPQPRSGFHSRPRTSPFAQPLSFIRRALPPCGRSKAPSPELHSPLRGVHPCEDTFDRAWGLVRPGAVSLFEFSPLQVTTSADEPSSLGQSTHGVCATPSKLEAAVAFGVLTAAWVHQLKSRCQPARAFEPNNRPNCQRPCER